MAQNKSGARIEYSASHVNGCPIVLGDEWSAGAVLVSWI
jgi:hypothetical protein